ncbi:MAG: insulinase family protein [Lysobacteraceae bacterium]
MISRFLLATLLATSLSVIGTVRAETPASKIFDLPHQMTELDNGLKVIIVRTDTPGVVSLQIPVQTGSRNEVEAGKSGFAHFFEHMMFRGTPNYPADKYGAIVKAAGGDQNAYTTDDHTNYYTTFTTDDLEKMIEIEADRFQHLSYSEEQFRTEALAVKGEYLKNYANPLGKGFERLSDIAYTVHPYKHTTMGFFADIEDMPNQMDYAKTFFDRWYRPEHAAVIVVGDVDPDATLSMVKKYWGPWQRGSYVADIPVEPPLAGPVYDHINFDGPTLPYLLYGFRAPAFDTAANADNAHDVPALMLLSELYFGQTSALYQKLVVEQRWVDQFFSDAPFNKDPALFGVVARLTDAKHAKAVGDAIRDTLVTARGKPLDAALLAETKSRVKYGFASRMDSADTIAGTLARFVQFERDPETLNQLYARFDAVTAQDIIDVANRVFVDSNRASISIANAESLPGANDFGSVDAGVAALANAPKADIDLLEQRSDSPLVDVSLIFHSGAAFDPPGKKGLAWLTASMLTEGGSQRRGIAEIQKAVYPLAAGFGAQVDKEMLVLGGQVHRDNLDAWYEIVREQLLTPGFREDDFERIKQQQLNAIRVSLRGNNDEEFGKEALYEQVYGAEHPYGTLNMGAAGDLEKLTLDDVKAFYAANFSAKRLLVGLAGNYPDGFRDRLLSDLANLPDADDVVLDAAPAAAAKARKALVIQKQTPAVAVSFGWPLDLKRGDPDWVALWLVRSYLGEHRNSSGLLYNRIREARGMNYGDYAYIEYFPAGMYRMKPQPNYARDNDLLQIWIRPLRSNNDALFATRAALFELDGLRENGIPEADFEATRNFLRKYVAILTASQDARLGYALDSRWFGTTDFIDYVRDGLETLTLDQVNAVIRKYVDTSTAQFVFISANAEELSKALTDNTASPMTYNSDKPQSLLDEDKVIEKLPFGLNADTVRQVNADALFE